MERVIVFGYGFQGVQAAKLLESKKEYEVIGFADNSPFKRGNYVYGDVIRGMEELKELLNHNEFSVVIASNGWKEIIEQCEENGITVSGVYANNRIAKLPFAEFSNLDFSKDICFYAGDIFDTDRINRSDIYGLSLTRHDDRHICHNIKEPYPIPDCSIASYEAEDVLEYIDENSMPFVIKEILRILKPGGLLRICMPDYNSPIMKKRTMVNENGEFLFDAGGGGGFDKTGITDGGSVYFAKYEKFDKILKQCNFSCVDWLCYYSNDGVLHRKHIDESKGNVHRIIGYKDEDVYSMLVDCYK